MLELEINEVSRITKLKPHTLRYYESIGLIMDIKRNESGKRIYNELIDELTKIPWIEFKINEGKNKIIHCTIVSKRIQDRFEEIWQYVNQYKCNFQAYFDNLSLYKWEDNTWILYKRIEFKDV
jgi:hypothetical protein